MRILRSLAQDRGLPYVAALEVRQATPELFPLLDALTCARLGISVGTFPQEASHLERPRNEALALPSREEALDRIPFPEAWAAARDLARALGLPAELRRRLTKTLGRDFRHLSPHRAREAEPLFREVLGEAPVKELLLRLLSLMEKGHVRHLMPHVGGVVVAPGPLTRYAPMVRSAGGVRMLTLDKDDLEALGLVKLDLLGLRMLSALEEAREEVFRTEGVWLDLEAKGFSELPLHPLDLVRGRMREVGATPLSALRPGPVLTAGLVVAKQKPPTAQGYAFLVLEDGPIRRQVVVPPGLWERRYALFRDAKLLLVAGSFPGRPSGQRRPGPFWGTRRERTWQKKTSEGPKYPGCLGTCAADFGGQNPSPKSEA